jgi:hypothetical protein
MSHFDPGKKMQELEKKFAALDRAYQMGQMDTVWKGLIEISQLDPTNSMAMELMASIYVSDPARRDAIRKWAGTPRQNATIDNRNCRFEPHVALATVGGLAFSLRQVTPAERSVGEREYAHPDRGLGSPEAGGAGGVSSMVMPLVAGAYRRLRIVGWWVVGHDFRPFCD